MKIENNSFVTIAYLINFGNDETYPPDGQPEEISFCMGCGVMPRRACALAWMMPTISCSGSHQLGGLKFISS